MSMFSDDGCKPALSFLFRPILEVGRSRPRFSACLFTTCLYTTLGLAFIIFVHCAIDTGDGFKIEAIFQGVVRTPIVQSRIAARYTLPPTVNTLRLQEALT